MVGAVQAKNERGNLMRCRNSFASILLACLLAAACLGIAPIANAAPAGSSFLSAGKGPTKNAIEVKDRGRVPRTYVPIAPSYRYYDYPYYYSRGYYPIHIRPGFIYYGYPYASYRSLYYRRDGGRCSYRHGRCVANSSHSRNPGSAYRRPHQRLGACRCL
jgi:hypothetical protein